MAKNKKHRRKGVATTRSEPAASLGFHDTLTPQLQKALALADRGDQQQAFKKFEDSIRHDPDNVRAYILAAGAYAFANQLDRTEEVLEKLVRRAPQHPGVYHSRGEVYAEIGLPEKAIESFEYACTLPDVMPGTWVKLASMYERSHQLEQAWELIQRSEEHQADFPALWILKARLQRRQKEPDLAEQTLLDSIGRLPSDHDAACQAWGEIALIRDQCEDYDGAIEAIESCKRGQAKIAATFGQGGEVIDRQLQNLFYSLRKEDFLRWQKQTKDLQQERVALLTGFPRSGTTLLEQVLAAHPQLISSEERDYVGRTVIHRIFANKLPGTPYHETLSKLSSGQLRFERNAYFEVMERLQRQAIRPRMHLDKNPGYNQVIPVMMRIFPETRLLVALRDPRDVVLSCYLRYMPMNTMSSQFHSVEKTARRYAADMGAWLTFRELQPGPWCEIRYEDCVNGLETEARRALSTLGLSWDKSVLDYREQLQQGRHVTSPTYEAVAQPIYSKSLDRWRHYQRIIEPAVGILRPFIAEFGYE